ncbi:MAG: cytochrome c biogenesis protein CcmG/thiol:disulfide interchange protein DsbE [Woeseiaceae bacterium]|jgi:cytochrome c biogenesis protein CcmG/thiol:disulfide interchange protein DsbE
MSYFQFKQLVVSICLTVLLSSGARASDESVILDLGDNKGKVVVVDFWASWCVPCRRSIPWLNNMQEKYGDQGLVIIGVNEDTSEADFVEFLKNYPAHFKTVRDTEGSLARKFDVVAMPSSFILDRDGNVVARHLGFKVRMMDDYEAVIRDALTGSEVGAELVSAAQPQQ